MAAANADLQALHCETVARMSKTCYVLEHKERETYKKQYFRILQKACEQHGKQDLLHGSQEPPVLRLLVVSAVWKCLGFVGRDVPPKISECFQKYMPRSQTFNFAIARPSWGLNQAPTSRKKGEKKKKLQYTFLFSRRKDLT